MASILREKNRNIRQGIFLLVAIFLCISIITGCSGSKDQKTSQNGTIELVFWRQIRFGGEEEMTKRITEAFMAEHPNTKVQVQNIPPADYPEKLKIAAATGTLPDIFTIDTHEPAYYAANSHLMQVPSDLAQFAKENIFEGNLNPVTWKDTVVALPLDSANMFIAYNVDLALEAGLDPKNPPKDWDELVVWATKMTKRDAQGNIIQAGFDPLYSRKNAWWFFNFVAAAGGNMWTQLDHVNFTEEPFVASLQYVKDLANVHKTFDKATTAEDFIMGRAGMMIMGPWDYQNINKANPKLNYKLTPMPPRQKGGKTGTMIGGWNIAVNSKSKYSDAAFEYIRFMMKKEYRLEWSKLTARPPAYKDIIDDSFYSSNEYYSMASKVQKEANIPYGKANAAIYEIYDAAFNAVERAVWKGEDVKTVLTEAKQAADKASQEKNK